MYIIKLNISLQINKRTNKTKLILLFTLYVKEKRFLMHSDDSVKNLNVL